MHWLWLFLAEIYAVGYGFFWQGYIALTLNLDSYPRFIRVQFYKHCIVDVVLNR